MSVNKVMLVGNLGADPEVRSTPGGRSVCNLSVATNEAWKDKEGVRQERTEWHRVTVWGPDADNCGKFLGKGSTVYIEGKLQTRSYEHEGQKRYATDVVAERVMFLGGKREGGRDYRSAGEGGDRVGRERGGWGDAAAGAQAAGAQDSGEDDIPL